MFNTTVSDLCDAVSRLDVTVDGEEIAAVLRACETAVAMTMAPLRAFDELMLYRLTKASSTAQFLERDAGLSSAQARSLRVLARKLKTMPLTEAAWIAGTISSGQVHVITTFVTKRLAERYTNNEEAVLRIVTSLDAKDTETAIKKWVSCAEAVLDDEDPKPPREDEFFHSESGGRYFSKGSFGALNGAAIDTAVKLAEEDNPRDDDTRSPAERRAEALSDVCSFYIDYRTHTDTDPDADAPKVPKKRNWPHHVAVNTTGDIAHHSGAQLLNGPHIDHRAFEALSCTAEILRLVLDENNAIRDYQLLPATITDALFGAIAARDQHCRWPGCHKKPIHCDVHHVHYQEHGGLNSPSCCCLMCKFHHHRAAHDPNIRMVIEPDGTLHITHPDGTTETTIPQSDNPDCRGTDQPT